MLAQRCACEQPTPPPSVRLSLPFLPSHTSIPPSALCAGVSGAGCRLPHQCVTMVSFEVCYSSVAHSPAHWKKTLQTGPAMSARRGGKHKSLLLNILYIGTPMAAGTKSALRQAVQEPASSSHLVLHHPRRYRPSVQPSLPPICFPILYSLRRPSSI